MEGKSLTRGCCGSFLLSMVLLVPLVSPVYEKQLVRGKRAMDVPLLLASPLKWNVGLSSAISMNLTWNSFPPVPCRYLGGKKVQAEI